MREMLLELLILQHLRLRLKPRILRMGTSKFFCFGNLRLGCSGTFSYKFACVGREEVERFVIGRGNNLCSQALLIGL